MLAEVHLLQALVLTVPLDEEGWAAVARQRDRALGTQQRLGVRGACRLSSLPNFSSQRLQQQRDLPVVSRPFCDGAPSSPWQIKYVNSYSSQVGGAL